jgi:hypothetical protein
MQEVGSMVSTDANTGNRRFYWFLASAVLSSLVFGLFLFTSMMVPGYCLAN